MVGRRALWLVGNAVYRHLLSFFGTLDEAHVVNVISDGHTGAGRDRKKD